MSKLALLLAGLTFLAVAAFSQYQSIPEPVRWYFAERRELHSRYDQLRMKMQALEHREEIYWRRHYNTGNLDERHALQRELNDIATIADAVSHHAEEMSRALNHVR